MRGAMLRGNRYAKSAVPARPALGVNIMNIVTNIGPLASLIAGILILILPRLLNYIVAIYLIIIGVVGLFGHR